MKAITAVLSMSAFALAAFADIEWKDVDSQLTPIGAGESKTGELATFDSWGCKRLPADGTYGTAENPFVSRYMSIFTSEPVELDLMAPGFMLFLR